MWKDGNDYPSLMKNMRNDRRVEHIIKENMALGKYTKFKNKVPNLHTGTFFGCILFYFEIDYYIYETIPFLSNDKNINCNSSLVYLTSSSMNKKINIVVTDCIETMAGFLKYNHQCRYIFWSGMINFS